MQNSVMVNDVNLVSLIDVPEWKSILLDLVNSEKMDPWDIDIIDLSEKYLKKINSIERTDLRVPANAILASAILLRAKSRLLKISSLEEEEKSTTDKIIEEFIPELKDARTLREGKISLDELVDAIQNIVEQTKSRKSRLRELPELKFQVPMTKENISEKMKKVFERIKQKADSQGMLLFSALIDGNNSEHLIDIFIPLLFLNNENKINLWQEEWLGEIFISLSENNAEKTKV
ncbi:MAG: ScpA family protein [archaeon]